MLMAVALRESISARVAEALIARGERDVTAEAAAARTMSPIPRRLLAKLAEEQGVDDAEIRGALLGRTDLPASARLLLVEAAVCCAAPGRAWSRAPSPPRGSIGCCATAWIPR